MAKCNSVPQRGTGVYRLYLVWKMLEPVGDQKESVSFNISQGELGSEMLYRRMLGSAPDGGLSRSRLKSDSLTSESLLDGCTACLFWGAEIPNPNSPLEVYEWD